MARSGQVKLKNAKVLVVGLGGLGCPAATYLSGAGVGELGLMDGDTVELSNLHRQTLHSMDTLGWKKVESAYHFLNRYVLLWPVLTGCTDLQRLNPKVKYRRYPHNLNPTHATKIFEQYDLILDCTDHPTSRYLISDACVLARKPLVSASALQTEGQLMTLNMPPGSGPCYRCIFPKPPPADSVLSCGEGGILGPVVGVMGVLQAANALEMITQYASLTEDRLRRLKWKDMPARLLIYSAFDLLPFRPIALKRRRDCVSCSSSPSITRKSLDSGSLDYAAFCGLTMPVTVLDENERVTAEEYRLQLNDTHHPHLLVDVREKLHFDICHLPGSINLPYSLIARWINKSYGQVESGFPGDPSLSHFELCANEDPDLPIYFVCRFGNDSQEAARFAKTKYPYLIVGRKKKRFIGDIKGGLHAWSQVDPTFPDY